MYNFTVKDLVYKYSLTAVPGDDPNITGKPDSNRFNRHEQYEVLRLIRHFYKINTSWSSASPGQKIERMVHEHLPSNIQSRQGVYDWIFANWSKYQ